MTYEEFENELNKKRLEKDIKEISYFDNIYKWVDYFLSYPNN